MGSDFKLDPKFEKAFLNSTDAKDALGKIGPPVVSRAKSLAPDDPKTSGKDLKSQIEFEVIRHPSLGCYVGRLVSRNFKSNWLHEGTRKIRKRPFLRQAVESEGFPIQKATPES